MALFSSSLGESDYSSSYYYNDGYHDGYAAGWNACMQQMQQANQQQTESHTAQEPVHKGEYRVLSVLPMRTSMNDLAVLIRKPDGTQDCIKISR